jgi:hypothetical protein
MTFLEKTLKASPTPNPKAKQFPQKTSKIAGQIRKLRIQSPTQKNKQFLPLKNFPIDPKAWFRADSGADCKGIDPGALARVDSPTCKRIDPLQIRKSGPKQKSNQLRSYSCRSQFYQNSDEEKKNDSKRWETPSPDISPTRNHFFDAAEACRENLEVLVRHNPNSKNFYTLRDIEKRGHYFSSKRIGGPKEINPRNRQGSWLLNSLDGTCKESLGPDEHR